MRMRLVALLVAVALVPAALAAPAGAGVRVGVEGGLNYAGVSNSLFGSLVDEELAYRPAWSAGVTVDVPLAKRLTLATGMRYIEYGERFDITFYEISDPSFGGTVQVHDVWRYLAVPVRVKYRPLENRGLFVGLGPEVGYLLEAANKATYDGQELASSTGIAAARPASQIFEQVGTFDNFTNLYERWNLALVGGLGYEFPLWGHEGAVEVRYSCGILDMATSTHQQTRGIEAVLGLRW